MSSVTTPWVVFLDADVSVSSDALETGPCLGDGAEG